MNALHARAHTIQSDTTTTVGFGLGLGLPLLQRATREEELRRQPLKSIPQEQAGGQGK